MWHVGNNVLTRRLGMGCQEREGEVPAIVGKLRPLAEEIFWCKASLTRLSHFACYCDAGLEDYSTIARPPCY